MFKTCSQEIMCKANVIALTETEETGKTTFELFAYWVILHAFSHLLNSFKVNLLEKNNSGIPPVSNSFVSELLPNCLKRYQQTTLVGKYTEGL